VCVRARARACERVHVGWANNGVNMRMSCSDRALLRRYRALLRRDRAFLQRDRAILKIHLQIIYRRMRMSCSDRALLWRDNTPLRRDRFFFFGGDIGFLCGNKGLVAER